MCELLEKLVLHWLTGNKVDSIVFGVLWNINIIFLFCLFFFYANEYLFDLVNLKYTVMLI